MSVPQAVAAVSNLRLAYMSTPEQRSVGTVGLSNLLGGIVTYIVTYVRCLVCCTQSKSTKAPQSNGPYGETVSNW